MRKKLSLLLLLLLIPLNVYAWGVMIVGGGVPAGGCVKDETPAYEIDDTSVGFKDISTTFSAGQTFREATAYDLYSIEVYMQYWSNAVVTMRIGTAADLRTVYLEEITSGTITGAGWVEFVSATNPEIVGSSTVHYTAFLENSGDVGLDLCTGADATERVWSDDGTTWLLATSDADKDVRFRVYKCQ